MAARILDTPDIEVNSFILVAIETVSVGSIEWMRFLVNSFSDRSFITLHCVSLRCWLLNDNSWLLVRRFIFTFVVEGSLRCYDIKVSSFRRASYRWIHAFKRGARCCQRSSRRKTRNTGNVTAIRARLWVNRAVNLELSSDVIRIFRDVDRWKMISLTLSTRLCQSVRRWRKQLDAWSALTLLARSHARRNSTSSLSSRASRRRTITAQQSQSSLIIPSAWPAAWFVRLLTFALADATWRLWRKAPSTSADFNNTRLKFSNEWDWSKS